MTIHLTKDTYVAGVLSASGSQHTLDEQTESYLVHIGAATWVETAYTQGRFEDAKIEYDSDGVAVGVVGRANEVVGPVWATDDSGNVTGLVGPGNIIRKLQNTTPRFLLLGDSITAAANAGITITAMARASNVVTCTSTNHSMVTGQVIRICNAMPDSFNGEYTVTYIDANTFSYPNIGVNESATLSGHPGGGSFDPKRMDWYKSQGWWVWLLSMFGGGIDLVKNLAVGGWSAQYAASTAGIAFFEEELGETDFSEACIAYGVNDLAASRTPAQILAYIQTLAEWALDKGARVWISAVNPVGTGHSAATTINKNAPVLNRLLADYARTTDNVYFVDTYSKMVDPLTGAAKTNAIEDNIHPSIWGARVLVAPAWYDAMNGLIKPISPLVTSIYDNYANSPLSPVLYSKAPWVNTAGGATTGTVTGDVAVSNRVGEQGSASVTASLSARADGFGYDQIVELAATANNDVAYIEPTDENSDMSIWPGKKIRMCVAFEITGNTAGNLKGFYSTIAQSVGGVWGYSYSGANALSNAQWGTSDDTITGVLCTPPMLINAAATNIIFEFGRITAAGSGTSTMKIGRVTVHVVP